MKDEIRDLKISIITNEINFRFDQNRVKELKNELRFIRKNFPDDIITGSLSLSSCKGINDFLNLNKIVPNLLPDILSELSLYPVDLS